MVLGRVLGRESVPLEAHLFDELAADSLSLAHFCRATREDPDLPAIGMRQIYRHPTLARLAAALARTAPEAPHPPSRSSPSAPGLRPELEAPAAAARTD